MTLSAELWAGARGRAEDCLAHPFVQGIGDGSLDPDRYRDFIAQDAYFLESFARGYAHCLATAPDRDGLYEFHSLLDGVFQELELHRGAAEALEIDLAAVRPAPATLAYTRFLDDAIAGERHAGETLAAMTPCMRLYAFLGSRLTEAGMSGGARPEYREWVDTYAGQEFQELADLMERLLDRYGEGSERERERYGRAMELEFQFFDAAWRGDAVG